ncbi:hypothetical protein V2J09_003691 [Rumex salicifolius]
MAPIRMSNDLIALFFLMMAAINVLSIDANIAEHDEYWSKREERARKAIDKAYHPHPYNVTNHLNHHVKLAMKESLNSNPKGRSMAEIYKGPCLATNPIDRCWRCDKEWEKNRMRLADCALGFGKGTTGGKGGRIYVVTDPSDDSMLEPKHGTLRHAVIQEEPLWIIFDRKMNINLKQELIMNGNKTIDARGSQVHITGGAGITIQYVENVIIHGLHIHDIFPKGGGQIRDSIDHFGTRTASDGDGISIYGSSRIWIDHVSLARCADGLIDAIEGSTAISITNVHMSEHNDVFLFGAVNSHSQDKKMQITVAFNRFGKELIQRMPRCRWGFFHVVNNDYTHWLMYAIGGSQQPTIISQGNRFIAPHNVTCKEVTKREAQDSEWLSWTWRSENDLFLAGAFFRQSGSPLTNNPYQHDMIPAQPGDDVKHLARFAGPLKCNPNEAC